MVYKQTYKHVPALRFPDFQNDGEWEVKRLGDCFTERVERNYIDLPLLSLTESDGIVLQEETNRKNNSNTDKSKYQRVCIGDIVYNTMRMWQGRCAFATIEGIVSPAYTICKPNKDMHSLYFYYIFKTKQAIELFHKNSQGLVNDTLNLKYENFAIINMSVPSLVEQKRIAAFLSSVDEMIAECINKLELLKSHKKGLMQKLFPVKGQKKPEFRFKEFEKDGEWENTELGDITIVVNRRNKSRRNLPTYSVNNRVGFIPQSEQFDGLDSESRGYDTSMYKIVGKHTFAYNPARINVGSIGYSGDLKEVLISSLYVCFKTTEEIDDGFLMCFFNTSQFNKAVENNVEGGIRSYLFYENFSRIKISIPSLSEQKKIASTLLSINNLMDGYAEKVLLLEEHKKGLMQRLFPRINK